MKINNFKISNYKNLKTKAVFRDLNLCDNYLALIGVNASGKSNVLEAISIIFFCLYDGIESGLKYTIQYFVKGKNVKVVNDILTSDGSVITRAQIKDYLPDQVIACYSGEEKRLWEDTYMYSFNEYFSKVLSQTTVSKPDMLYIDKSVWDIALIALMCSENESTKAFLKDVLGIIVTASIEVSFDFDTSKYPAYSRNEVLRFINRINPYIPPREKETISINTLRTFDIGQINDSDRIRKTFLYLYIATLSNDTPIITNIEISLDKKNKLTMKSLSEGEKKLLLVEFIMNGYGDENTLYLFDEPDAHMHISRKKELINYFKKENYFTVLTTHSPTLLHYMDEKCVRLVQNGDKGLEVIKIDKLKQLETLTDGAFTVMDAALAFATSNDILLVEGITDYKYLTKAIEVLKRTKAPKYHNLNLTIINCGGADNIKAVYEEAIKPHIRSTQLCIITFDDDKKGRDNIAIINSYITANPGLTNLVSMVHPKTRGFTKPDFYMEDYFPVAAYKTDILTDFTSATDFQDMKKTQDVKKQIEKKYSSFIDGHFDNFEAFFDKIEQLQSVFRPPT